MNRIDSQTRQLSRFSILWVLIFLWATCVAVSLIWNLNHIRSDFLAVAKTNASMSLAKDLEYRKWAAGHGGVYVPVSDKTPPNPFLAHLPDRDITSLKGRDLTLVNPAYMHRQVNEMALKGSHLQAHITSLKPLRPENAADEWETEALKTFENGRQEAGGIQLMGDQPVYRLMRPLKTEVSCLKCHASQGYQPGDLHGGIGVVLSLAPYLNSIAHQRTMMSVTHILVGGLVMIGLIAGARKIEDADKKNRDLLMRYELIMQGAAGGIWDWDICKKQVYFSPVWKAMRGYQENEISDSESEWSDDIHPDDKKKVMAEVQDHFKGKSKVFNLAYRVRRKDGSWIWIRDRGKVLRDHTGRVIRMAGSEVDITDYVNARNQLLQSEQRYKSLADVSPSGIWQTDETGANTFVSSRWVEITGISMENAAGSGWCEKIHPDDKERIRSGWYRHASTRQSYRSEFRFVRSDGRTVWVLCTARPQKDENEAITGWIGNITDITPLKEEQAKKEELIRSLKAALAEIKTLNQLLPICSSCKKIRDDTGYWNQIETYIAKHSQAQFTHSICPDCAAELYPEMEDITGQKKNDY